MMSCAKGRTLLINLLIAATVCRCSPIPDSGPGIEILPAEFSADGQPNYILVDDKRGGSIMNNQQLPNKQPVLANAQPQYQQQPQAQYYYHPQDYQPQYSVPQYQQSQYQQPQTYQRPQQIASYSVPVEVPSSQYHPFQNRLAYPDSPGPTSSFSSSDGNFQVQRVVLPSATGAAVLGAAALLFG